MPRTIPFSIGVVAVVLGVVGSLLMALPSCEALPDKTCRGEQVNGLTVDAGALDPKCTSCLQTNCCDAVGYCSEDNACATTFRRAHECVLEGGPASESECINELGASTQRSRQLYDCMRTNCGGSSAADASCGISNCNIDPSVVLLASPTCDRCLGGNCCREINDCYGDRRCKLAVECIVRQCEATLGPEMTQFGAAGQETIDGIRHFVCTDTGTRRGIAQPPTLAPAGECVLGCLAAFAPVEGTADDDRARCRALDVYACGAKAGCGAACTKAETENLDASRD